MKSEIGQHWAKPRDIGIISVTLDTNSHLKCSIKKTVLKKSAIFIGKQLC